MPFLDNPMVLDEIANHVPVAECECDQCGDVVEDEKYDDGDEVLCRHCLLDKYLVPERW